ncbi:MAG: Rrf2 family transcriptional regulator [Phycisphaeraceae bacterium]|nr:Rrf2 family transcriptional regulator [Phycisphaeraceae bacterium]
MISQTSEYALRAVMYLAQDNDHPRTTAEISEHTLIPPGYLSKVLRTLSQAGLLHARRGIGGGFSLARAPEGLTVLDIFNAVGDDITRISQCPLGSSQHTSLCAMHQLLDDVHAYIENRFRSTSIQDLINSAAKSHLLCRPEHRSGLTGITNPSRNARSKA